MGWSQREQILIVVGQKGTNNYFTLLLYNGSNCDAWRNNDLLTPKYLVNFPGEVGEGTLKKAEPYIKEVSQSSGGKSSCNKQGLDVANSSCVNIS